MYNGVPNQTSGLGFRRGYGVGNIPVYQRDKAFLLAQGGFALDVTNLTPGQIIPAGTPLIFNETTRMAVVLLTASLYANAANNATTYQVKKGGNLKVGSNFAATIGGAAYPITAIDTSNANYDVVTVGTTLGVALTAGQDFFASVDTGATAADFPAGINGLLYEDTYVEYPGISQAVSAVIRGTVYARRVFYSAQLAALPGLAQIIYSQSY